LFCAAQAVDMREQGPDKLGRATRIAHDLIREQVEVFTTDKEMTPSFEKLTELIQSESIIQAIGQELKEKFQ